ncbi:MAG: alpha-ketoglutarate-dependent dioxygenase AlkB, partial [Planctomycetes bacterium]|nr:alpha-ketoglutarate-dependent dioxygenase AlkB [Planctomycetota bacterium]
MSPPEGFQYVASFLSIPEQRELLRVVRDLPFTRDRFRGKPLKRRYAQFGFEYISTGRRLKPAAPLPRS